MRNKGNPKNNSELERAVDAISVIRALKKECFLSDEDIAKATGAIRRSVINWKKTGSIRLAFFDRLIELRDVVLILRESLKGRGIKQWLNARNRLLSGRRPIDLLAEKEFKTVVAAAYSYIEGSYV